MATLEEVRDLLMKPAKDLADWNFPFSKILGQYCTLLSKTHNINYSELGLVVQNCGNIYVRRFGNMSNDFSSLIQSFINHESTEQTKTCTKKNSKNTVIDFGDFEPIDFSKSVGKNTNMKIRTGINTSVKLLSQRFPHLENVSRSSLPIKVYDIHGEVIGKKSDFRCNQYLTSTGMLVEHLTPEDFSSSYVAESCNNIQSNSQDNNCIASSVNSESANSSCTKTVSSINVEDSTFVNSGNAVVSNTANTMENENEDCDNSLDCESAVISNNTVQDSEDFLDSSFVSSFDSGVGLSPQSALNTTRTESLAPDEGDNEWDRASSITSISDIDNNDEDQLDIDSTECTTPSTEQTLQSTDRKSEGTPASVSSRMNSTPEKNGQNFNKSISLDSGYISREIESEKKSNEVRHSKRRKNVIDDVNHLSPTMWEPIPFEGVPKRSQNNRATFVLPCSVALLKCRDRPRKRKISTESQKKKRLTELFANESETASKKMTMYSPTRQLFIPLKKEDFDILGRCFKDQLKTRQSVDTVRYDAVTTAAMDLLGYHKNSADNNNDDECIDHIDNDSTVTSVETEEFPMPETPESVCDGFDEFSSISSLPNYHSRIEKTVRDIYEAGSDLLNDQQEAISRWHRHIQPILRKGELRPPFDITEYSKRVMRCIREHNEPCIEFKKIVENHEKTEIARYFMATLQLANTYDLQIKKSDTAEGDITLVLLDK